MRNVSLWFSFLLLFFLSRVSELCQPCKVSLEVFFPPLFMNKCMWNWYNFLFSLKTLREFTSVVSHQSLEFLCENIIIISSIPLINCRLFRYPVFLCVSCDPIFFFLLGPRMQHIVVPRLGVELEPQPQQCQICATSATYTTAHQQWQILNPLSKARDRTCTLMDTSQIHYH